MNLLEVKKLRKVFTHKKKSIIAVDDVSFSLKKGETIGLVGKSGSGKSTLAKMILNLLDPTEGEIFFLEKNISRLSKKETKNMRKEMQMVFQDPFSSLNPRMNIEQIISEPIIIHNLANKNEIRKRVLSLLDMVCLSKDSLYRYPHEFSGGQRQRICIARSLATNPCLLICDEPISSLDMSIQSQIINLLIQLQRELGLTYLFIAHNLAVVRHISDRILVMHNGKIIEEQKCNNLFSSPKHYHTKELLKALRDRSFLTSSNT
jgi:ABC-type oligopeptide transport system ATPase subunit